jgi:hypothetical protein
MSVGGCHGKFEGVANILSAYISFFFRTPLSHFTLCAITLLVPTRLLLLVTDYYYYE